MYTYKEYYETEIPKHYKITIYEVYSQLTITCNTKMRTSTKRNKSKIQAMEKQERIELEMKFLEEKFEYTI
jgi:hypothetical protein